jgi:hypothetical protein
MTVDELLGKLHRLITAARSLDLATGDEPGTASSVSAAEVIGVLEQTVSFLDQVQAHYGFSGRDAGPTPAGDATGLNLDSIGELMSSEIAVQEIGILTYSAGRQLRSAIADLTRADAEGETGKAVSACHAALRCFRRAVLPIEISICELEERELPVRSWSDLVTSLDTRRLYGRLRRKVFFPGVPGDDQLEERLTEILHSIGELRTTEIYPSLRAEDRHEIRALARQIKEWLGEPQPTAEAGRKLWNRLVGFVNRLALINLRQQLCRHDRQIIAEVCQVLCAEQQAPESMSDELRERLRQVLGRDDELDRLILEPAGSSLLDWQETLQRLLTILETDDQVYDDGALETEG